VLTGLRELTRAALVPSIWPYEVLNAIGKGVLRKRVDRKGAIELWQRLEALPIQIITVPADENLLELALQSNLAVYDASYLSLALARRLPLATGDGKLQAAAQSLGLEIIRP
jgi:predicted nucleic acid-binding protein